MAKEGRVEGRVNGDAYEIVHYGVVTQSIPLSEAKGHASLLKAIDRNKWEKLP